MEKASAAARNWSFAVFGLGLLVVARWDLGHSLLAGLFAYLILEQTERLLREAGMARLTARTLAVILFLLVAVLLSLILASFLRIGLTRLPLFLDRLFPRLGELAARLGLALPVDNASDLRAFVLDAARDNARSITATSGVLTRGFFQILVAVGAALAKFLAPRDASSPAEHFHFALSHECRARGSRLWTSFALVVSAQVLSAAVNTGVTAAFLFAARVPFRTFLTLATFVCGVIPVAGSAASGAMVVAAAFTHSTHLALVCLAFLLVWHKVQYFVSGRIVGAHLDMPLWAILIGLLAGEALMGVTGLVLAPTLLHYAREELRAIPARSA